MTDEPEDAGLPDPVPPPSFEAPHRNGAGPADKPKRTHAPWEFLILSCFVLLLAVGIILGWTLVGSHSPERLDPAAASALSSACNRAQATLKALPNPSPRLGADRVARVRAENGVLRHMVGEFDAVRPEKSTPAAEVKSWAADWSRVIDARARYADDLAAVAGTDAKVRLVLPASKGGIKPVTGQMDDFVRENNPNLIACFTEALQLEVVEGPREYKKVTS